MKYPDNDYISQQGLYWPEVLRKDIPKSKTALQPIYEAFTNSIEAIRDKQKIDTALNFQLLRGYLKTIAIKLMLPSHGKVC